MILTISKIKQVVNIISPYFIVSCEGIIETDMAFDFEASTIEEAKTFPSYTKVHEDSGVINVSKMFHNYANSYKKQNIYTGCPVT